MSTGYFSLIRIRSLSFIKIQKLGITGQLKALISSINSIVNTREHAKARLPFFIYTQFLFVSSFVLISSFVTRQQRSDCDNEFLVQNQARLKVCSIDILYTLDSASLLVKLKPRIFQRLPPFE